MTRNHAKANGAARVLAQLIQAAYPLRGGRTPAPSIRAEGWPDIADAARQHGLAPMLYAALKAAGRMDEPPADVQQRLQRAYVLTDTANWLAFQELERLLAALSAVQADVALLKGCALAATLYPEIGSRPMGDLDLLIRREALATVQQVMAGQGYQPMQEMAGGFGQSYLQEQVFVRSGARPAQVDAHWHLTSMPYYRNRIPIEWFWERAVEQPLGDRLALVFTPEAQLLHLALHFALHHGSGRLMWSYDVALLLARHAAGMDWQCLADAARQFGLGLALQRTLDHVADWWGMAVAPDAQARLDAVRPGWRERVLTMVMTSPRREARVLADGLSLPGVRAKAGYWLSLAFPDRDYMRQRYRVNRPALLPLYYARRMAAGLWKLIRSAWVTGLGAVRGRALL
jgi:hypothetical protein